MAGSAWSAHGRLERHSLLLLVAITIVVAIGGLVEVAPLFYIQNTIEPVQGMRPYTPLELEGRDIYIREGCSLCHSQMIRSLRDEVERYGHYSLAAESMYDHPFQWGSERQGPDLARVGGKYSDGWHRDHLVDPRSMVPESVMPPYRFLAERDLDYHDIQQKMRTMRAVGVPYTEAQIQNAEADLHEQDDPFSGGTGVRARYGKNVSVRNFGGDPAHLTEMDALVAYLQMLGTLVDFRTYKAEAPGNQR
ncbi:MAG TPA: cytochrome-c oxidase, cbb3-type subunit II [Caulobacteraceae bacterium]|nr:cytochrome-c oxidase, cbb3-type subunit II [Caulobacteraceae bacterium]